MYVYIYIIYFLYICTLKRYIYIWRYIYKVKISFNTWEQIFQPVSSFLYAKTVFCFCCQNQWGVCYRDPTCRHFFFKKILASVQTLQTFGSFKLAESTKIPYQNNHLKKYASIIPGGKVSTAPSTHKPMVIPSFKKDVWALFLPLTHTDRAAHTLSTE